MNISRQKLNPYFVVPILRTIYITTDTDIQYILNNSSQNPHKNHSEHSQHPLTTGDPELCDKSNHHQQEPNCLPP